MFICTNCGFKGSAKKIMKGGLGTEIIFYLLGIIPGLIYSVWRSSTKYYGCPKCQKIQ